MLRVAPIDPLPAAALRERFINWASLVGVIAVGALIIIDLLRPNIAGVCWEIFYLVSIGLAYASYRLWRQAAVFVALVDQTKSAGRNRVVSIATESAAPARATMGPSS